MKQAPGQDKGVSVAEGLKNAGATMQENLEKAGATISAQAEKMKGAGDEEAGIAADLSKDTRQAAAADRAEAKKAQHHEEAKNPDDHPAPFTKTPFV